ncbi:MAG: hypothetical protein ACI857_001012 [Arenicella sp.]|jgi:hypothetical protein
MKLAVIVILLALLLMPAVADAQLTGFSASYGKSYKRPLDTGGEYIKSNPFDVEYHQYLQRFWSATAQGHYEAGNFYDQNHVANPFSITRVGGTLNYWILNDLRLLGKMARSSCKGRQVALTYKFRISLTAGLYGNILNSPENNIKQTYMSYAFGVNVNLFQFSFSKFPLEFRMGTKYVLIPFVKAYYLRSHKRLDIGPLHSWKPEKLEFKAGLKFGFAGR